MSLLCPMCKEFVENTGTVFFIITCEFLFFLSVRHKYVPRNRLRSSMSYEERRRSHYKLQGCRTMNLSVTSGHLPSTDL